MERKYLLFVCLMFGSRALLLPNQQSGIHCQMICWIQLLTLNILERKHMYLLDITGRWGEGCLHYCALPHFLSFTLLLDVPLCCKRSFIS